MLNVGNIFLWKFRFGGSKIRCSRQLMILVFKSRYESAEVQWNGFMDLGIIPLTKMETMVLVDLVPLNHETIVSHFCNFSSTKGFPVGFPVDFPVIQFWKKIGLYIPSNPLAPTCLRRGTQSSSLSKEPRGSESWLLTIGFACRGIVAIGDSVSYTSEASTASIAFGGKLIIRHAIHIVER